MTTPSQTLAHQAPLPAVDMHTTDQAFHFADRADRSVLNLVLCAAVATLVLALACRLGG
jgi:hypothetical protein